MTIKNVGLITYHHPHLKTEQVLSKLLSKNLRYYIYGLPYTPRKPREVLFQHRPDQNKGLKPEVMAKKNNIPYVICQSDKDIKGGCDVYLVLGAGLLSPACVSGKKIINCHPGIIPSSRGLDSFKWAIYEMKAIGVSLHYIDENVDQGEIISIVRTKVKLSDTIMTLANRHYETEIDMMARFDEYLSKPVNPFKGIETGEAHMRMPLETEKKLEEAFSAYKEKYGTPG